MAMCFNLCAVSLLTLCILVGYSDAENCVAQSVENLTLDAFHILSWCVSEKEVCQITEFVVQIWQIGVAHEYSISVNDTKADVSFLEVCEEWHFVVVPISENVPGYGRVLIQNLPLPADADISLGYLNVTQDEATGNIHLHWDLADRQYGNCSLVYRLTVEQDGNPTIDDLYVSNRTVDLHFLAPCTEYQFGVRAINLALPTVEGPEKIAFHTMPAVEQGRPILSTVEVGTHEANITWRLQSYARNPCWVSELRLQDDGVFNLLVPIEDSTIRSDVTVIVESLEPNTSYTVLADVHNTAGWSEPAEVTFRTLENLTGKESIQTLL